jgi:hypothetical protein
MSNFHFDLSLKLSQEEVHDISGEVQKFVGEVRISLHLPSKSGHAFCSNTGPVMYDPYWRTAKNW